MVMTVPVCRAFNFQSFQKFIVYQFDGSVHHILFGQHGPAAGGWEKGQSKY